MCFKCFKRWFRTVMLLVQKLYKCFMRKIMKITVCELFCSVLLLVFITLLWSWGFSNRNSEIPDDPIILWWSEGFPETSATRLCPNNFKCVVHSDRNFSDILNVQAFLFYGSETNLSDLPERRPEDVVWGLFHEESPRNVEQLMHESVLNIFNFSATYSRHSNVPFPLLHLESLDVITSKQFYVETSEKNAHLKEISPILYLQSDCETSTERDIYVKELMKYIKIDSYGACLNNKVLPEKFSGDYLNNLDEVEFLRFVARYKFVVAIENGVCVDYLTEKFWRPIKVGSVPIYFGSPTVKDWFPNQKSAILLEDFPTPKVMADHLNKLLSDDDLYETYLEHKIKQVITNKKLIEEAKERPYQFDALNTVVVFECFVCEKLHRRLKGDLQLNLVTKLHYDCPKPISALTLSENPTNSWVQSWEYNRDNTHKIYKQIMNLE